MYKKVVDWVLMMCPYPCFTYHTPWGISQLLAYLPPLFPKYFHNIIFTSQLLHSAGENGIIVQELQVAGVITNHILCWVRLG